MVKYFLAIVLVLMTCFGISNYIDLKTRLNIIESELTIEKNTTEELRAKLLNAENEIEKLKSDVNHIKIKLAKDFIKYKHIDNSKKSEILSEIWKQAKQYEIDPAFLYAVLWKESRFRNDVIHAPVHVKSLNKVVQAHGMGAIIWDFWGPKLTENTSLTNKNDLKDWRKNIEGTAYILSYLTSLSLVKGTKNKYESAASRYYGKYNHNYVSQTLNKYLSLK